MKTVDIDTKMIRLGQFLKKADLVSTGGEVKQRIQQGEVKVNDLVDQQRGKQLRVGFVVEVEGSFIKSDKRAQSEP